MITDATPLGEARDWLRQRALTEGSKCPCCSQLARVYRRAMTATTGRAMVAMHRQEDDWVHLPTLVKTQLSDVAHQGGYAALAQHWGLIQEARDAGREDGGRAGWWRLTIKGRAFVQDGYRVPKYAHIYDGRCLGHSGEPVGVRDVLGTKFDYAALMRGEA